MKKLNGQLTQSREEWDRAHASYSKVAMSLEEYTSLLHFIADGLVGATAMENEVLCQPIWSEAIAVFEQVLEDEPLMVIEDLEEPVAFETLVDNDIEGLIFQQPFEGFPS